MTIAIKHSASASGAGVVTAEDLVSFGSQVPPKTEVSVSQRSDQREGSGWTLSATWDDATHNAWQGSKPPSITYPPGVRGDRKLNPPGTGRLDDNDGQFWGTGHP